MISPARLYDQLKDCGINFFTGVPDSLMKDFLGYVADNSGEAGHIITANEGLAVGLAAGYHFGTGKIPLVYLQNSGLGNIVNPVTSLCDKEMYSVPMILLIGWRGEPGLADEPQHQKMGKITTGLLNVLDVPYLVLNETEETCFQQVKKAVEMAGSASQPVALLVTRGIFSGYTAKEKGNGYSLDRQNLIAALVGKMRGDEKLICTTGYIGREFYEQNERFGRKVKSYLLSVGSMGHAGHIALGLQLGAGGRTILLDGDGALIMHLGSMTTQASYAKPGFVHIVINNGCHESVGAQPTEAFRTDLCALARACGFRDTELICDAKELSAWLEKDWGTEPVFVEIRTGLSDGQGLARPAGQPIDWKNDLVSSLKKSK